MESNSLFSLIAFICYSVATLYILSRLFHPSGTNNVLISIFGSIAIGAHFMTASHLLTNEHQVNFSLANVITLVNFSIVFIISIASLRFKVKLLLPVIYGFSALWQLAMIFIEPLSPNMMINDNVSVLVHITFALSAYCILVIANLFAFQVAYISNKLKNKNLHIVHQLPPLMQVEKQLFIILIIGSITLFLSEIFGFIFLDYAVAKQYAHKTLFSLLAGIIYFVTIFGHFKLGWRGQKVLTLTTSATFLLTLGYFGSRFVKEFLLS